ncbi:MAG TPA: trypsin-like peptidase domain-containing protein [Solirubrobacteraceae bacterium]|nr:trypsin-like peptidase domain-containing protein [Solirubrobacteraceae bacterium]
MSDRGAGARAIYDRAKESVAFVAALTPQGQATGTGWVAGADGLLVTNAHVVDGAEQVQVKIGTGGALQPARVVGSDLSTDLAVLQVDARGLVPLELGDGSAVRVGDEVSAIGNPYGLDHTLTTGIVSAVDRTIQAPDGTPIPGAIQTDAALNPGNSGGPLLDADGRLIGVNAQIASPQGGGNTGIGFAIPAQTVERVLRAVTGGGSALGWAA